MCVHVRWLVRVKEKKYVLTQYFYAAFLGGYFSNKLFVVDNLQLNVTAAFATGERRQEAALP